MNIEQLRDKLLYYRDCAIDEAEALGGSGLYTDMYTYDNYKRNTEFAKNMDFVLGLIEETNDEHCHTDPTTHGYPE